MTSESRRDGASGLAPETRREIRAGSFRRRLTIAFILVAAASAGILAIGSYLLVREERQRTFEEGALREARLGRSFASAALADSADAFDIQRLIARYRRLNELSAEDFHALVLSQGQSFSSHDSLGPGQIPEELRSPPSPDTSATADAELGSQPFLAVRPPLVEPDTQLYFFFSKAGLSQGLGRLLAILVLGWVGVIALAAVAGSILARRTLQPVAYASAAAQSLAEGLLHTRLPIETRDEFGAWAASFNRMAAALEEKIAALSAAHEREKRFTSDVSHELRTPLTALVSAASLLKDQLEELPPSARWSAQRLIDGVARLRHLIGELIEISRLDAGRESVTPELLDLSAVVRRLVLSRGWQSEIYLEAQNVHVLTDPRRVERIIANLLENAVMHGQKNVRVRVGETDGKAFVEVLDDGPGIPSEHLAHIFERFYKADASRGGGSGLGLSIASENARLIGADITVTSEPGRGSRFLLKLPAVSVLERQELES